MTGKVSDTDSSLGFVTWFANCFGSGSPDHLVKDCPKEMGENCQEGRFKLERGDGREGRPVLSGGGGYTRGHPSQCLPEHKNVSDSFLPETRPTHALEWA